MNNEELEALVERYGEMKGQLDVIKKQTDKDKEIIKQSMDSLDMEKFESPNYIAKLSFQEKQSLNEEAFIPFLHENFEDISSKYGIIKKKEYIDSDALENAIYKNAFSTEQLSSLEKFTETTIITKLNIRKVKK